MDKIEIQTGDFVKVRSHGERFWCIITGRGDTGYTGTVNNNLVVAPYEFGQTIAIQEADIIDHMKPKEPKGE
jgi:uncharacterized protein YegJ (DUF2314 family)